MKQLNKNAFRHQPIATLVEMIKDYSDQRALVALMRAGFPEFCRNRTQGVDVDLLVRSLSPEMRELTVFRPDLFGQSLGRALANPSPAIAQHLLDLMEKFSPEMQSFIARSALPHSPLYNHWGAPKPLVSDPAFEPRRVLIDRLTNRSLLSDLNLNQPDIDEVWRNVAQLLARIPSQHLAASQNDLLNIRSVNFWETFLHERVQRSVNGDIGMFLSNLSPKLSDVVIAKIITRLSVSSKTFAFAIPLGQASSTSSLKHQQEKLRVFLDQAVTVLGASINDFPNTRLATEKILSSSLGLDLAKELAPITALIDREQLLSEIDPIAQSRPIKKM